MRVAIQVICIETVSERWKLLAVVLFQSPLLSDSFIRELVNSLRRDGADAQYMQYLTKCRISSPQIYTLKAYLGT